MEVASLPVQPFVSTKFLNNWFGAVIGKAHVFYKMIYRIERAATNLQSTSDPTKSHQFRFCSGTCCPTLVRKTLVCDRREQRPYFWIKCPTNRFTFKVLKFHRNASEPRVVCKMQSKCLTSMTDAAYESLWNAWTTLPSVKAAIFIKGTTSISFQSRLDAWNYVFQFGAYLL